MKCLLVCYLSAALTFVFRDCWVVAQLLLMVLTGRRRVGVNRSLRDTNPQNFVTNHFVVSNVIIFMGWSPQIESRLREIRMMIPEIRAVIADDDALVRDQLRQLLAEESGVEIVAECSDALQTIAAVRSSQT